MMKSMTSKVKNSRNSFQQPARDTWNVMKGASSATLPWLFRTRTSLQQPSPPISTQQCLALQSTEMKLNA